MTTFRVEVATTHRGLAFDVLGQKRLESGDEAEVIPGVTVRYDGGFIRKALGIPEEVYFVVGVSSGVPAGLVANWLYDKLKGHVERITIDRVEIEFSEGEIERVIHEKTEIER